MPWLYFEIALTHSVLGKLLKACPKAVSSLELWPFWAVWLQHYTPDQQRPMQTLYSTLAEECRSKRAAILMDHQPLDPAEVQNEPLPHICAPIPATC